MRSLKAAVTRFFRQRRAAIETLNGLALTTDDFFELHVLVRFVQQQPGAALRNTALRAGRTVFRVAASPSPSWSRGSHFVLKMLGSDVGLRTGLSVKDAAATVELDVVLVDIGALRDDSVPSGCVVAGVECKHHARAIQQPHANEALGKAYRVFGLPPGVVGTAGPPRYAVVSLNGFSPNARAALQTSGIEAIEDLGAGGALDAHASATVNAR